VKYAEFHKVTRITVVGNDGIEYEKYDLFENGCEAHLQDGGRTLKIFPRQKESTE
jgi:hypothetical protein